MVKSFQLLGVNEHCSIQHAQQQHQQLQALIKQSDQVPAPLLELIDRALEQIEKGNGSESLFGIDEKMMLKIVAMHQRVGLLERQNSALKSQLNEIDAQTSCSRPPSSPRKLKWGMALAFGLFGLVFLLFQLGILTNPYLPQKPVVSAELPESFYTSNLTVVSTVRWNTVTFEGENYLAVRNQNDSLLVRDCQANWYHLLQSEQATPSLMQDGQLIGQYQKYLIYQVPEPHQHNGSLYSNKEGFSARRLQEQLAQLNCL